MRFFNRKHNRLYSEKEIGNLFAEGSSHFIYPIKVLFLTESSNEADYKVLVTVSKRNLKRAVQRNIVKRRIKEAFRLNSSPLRKSLEEKKLSVSLAFIYVSSNIISYNEIEERVIKQIKHLCNAIERIEK